MSKFTRIQTTGVLTELKDKAEQEALRQGFGNLNDAVRMFISQFAQGQLKIGGFKPQKKEYFSPEQLAEYDQEAEKALRDFDTGKIKGYTKGEIKNLLLDLLDEENSNNDSEV